MNGIDNPYTNYSIPSAKGIDGSRSFQNKLGFKIFVVRLQIQAHSSYIMTKKNRLHYIKFSPHAAWERQDERMCQSQQH